MGMGAGAAIQPAATSGRQLRALVFDDEPDMRTLIAAHLDRFGIAAKGICTKLDLADALTLESPGLIVLDLSLGETDALDVLSFLRDEGFEGRIVLISGHDAHVLHHVERLGLQAGLDIAGTLRKPFRRRDLKAVLETFSASQSSASECSTIQCEVGAVSTAIANDCLEFWFQPKIDIASGKCVGAEALARIRDPQHGIISPAAFLPCADAGELRELAVRAAQASAEACRQLSDAGYHLPIAINIAGRLLNDESLIDDLKSARQALPPGCALSIEITETDVIEDKNAAERFATRALLNGFAISIDDFGSGYATFERLRHIPFAELKLDRANVNGCAYDKGLEGICRAAVELGHSFGAQVVAEGVEDKHDLALLGALGFDIAQGYIFARPLPLEDFLAFIEQDRR